MHEVWKNGRLGIASNTVNPQASKVHRHLITMESWQNEIDPSNQEQLTQFQLAVAESLGVKVDKLTIEESLAQYEELIKQPEIEAAVAALKTLESGSYATGTETTEMQASILAGVEFGGEKMFSLDGLVALAESMDVSGDPGGYELTPTTEAFTTNLFREVDGITNGVMIGMIQLMGDSPSNILKTLQRGGLFSDGTESYGEWKAVPTNDDSYEE